MWQLDLEDESNNAFQNEDLIVWMRTAALPTFRKLYRKINNTQPPFNMGLLLGYYRLDVNYCESEFVSWALSKYLDSIDIY